MLIAWARPKYWSWSWRQLWPAILLGVVTAGMMLAFLNAVARLPLGTAVALEFMGPLTVAVLHSKSWRALVWPILALAGVLLLTRPWSGSANLVGVAFGLAAAACWGLYIVITQHVGDTFAGLDGLAISMPVACLVLTGVGLPEAWGHLTAHVLLLGLVVAALAPLIPFSLEMYALRRMSTAAFGTFTALEPGVGALVGAAVLHQVPTWPELVGLGLVVVAGVGAERRGRRISAQGTVDPLGG